MLDGEDMEKYINKIINADCMDILKQLPDGCVDLVVTDCPYRLAHQGGGGRCLKKWKTAGQLENYENVRTGKMFSFNDIDFIDWLPQVYRVLKNGTHCYIMINSKNLSELQIKAEQVGFKFQNLLVWKKNNATPNKFYMQQCEFILMLRKGRERWINNMGEKNFFSIPNPVGRKLHPTEKPISLMKIMIENSSNEGDLVIDPFSGSSPVAIVCKNLRRRFICIEKDPKYWANACERLKAEQAQMQLF